MEKVSNLPQCDLFTSHLFLFVAALSYGIELCMFGLLPAIAPILMSTFPVRLTSFFFFFFNSLSSFCPGCECFKIQVKQKEEKKTYAQNDISILGFKRPPALALHKVRGKLSRCSTTTPPTQSEEDQNPETELHMYAYIMTVQLVSI